MVYIPAGVPAATLTIPVAGSRTGTEPLPIGVAGVIMLTFTSASTTATPFNLSLSNALIALVVPVLPLIPVTTSAVAKITAASTVTEMVAVLQLLVFSFSQME